MAFAGKQLSPRSQTHPDARMGGFSYLPALDGWRAISILLVVVSHGGLGQVIPGGLGVTIFFFISGFLITSLLISEMQAGQGISLKRFYMRRLWRLSPPLLAYVFFSFVLIVISTNRINYSEFVSSVFYFANYYSIYWNYKELPFGPSPLGILWSLAIEEHYYIVFAPLMALLANTKRRLFVLIVFLIAAPLFVRTGAFLYLNDAMFRSGYTYMATEARIDSIAWGGLFAWICKYVNSADLKKILDRKATVGISFGVMLSCLLVRDDFFRESIRYTLQGLALVPLFYATLFGKTLNTIRKMLVSKTAIWIGKLSYSIYLYHWLALVITIWFIGDEKLSLSWLSLYYSLAAALSIMSYRFVEIPSLAFRKKYGSHAVS